MKARVPQGPSRAQMMQQFQKLQEDMASAQAVLEDKTYHVTAGGGAIEVDITGRREVTSVVLKPEVVAPDDIEFLQDLIKEGVNEAIRTCNQDAEETMNALTGGLNLGM